MPYRSINDPVKLRRVLEATLLLESDLDLPVLLRHVLAEACAMTGARYGALGVLDEERTALAEFITTGLGDADEERIGARPTGRGVLGLLITDPHPIRLANLGNHSDSYGFPPGHPEMSSFLGVPIKVRGEVYGNLYLTDKVGWPEFTDDDEGLVVSLAVSAGIAIDNARLHQGIREAAVYADRERLARDLHDTVIQRLFAIGLTLQSIAGSAAATQISDRLTSAVEDLDETIKQIRSRIFELTSSGPSIGVRDQVIALAGEMSHILRHQVITSFEGPVDTTVSDRICEHLLMVVREALTNVGRHAQASRSTVKVVVDTTTCRLEILDNGKGLDTAETRENGLGLTNMRHRAEKLGGDLRIENPPSGGAAVIWQVPLRQPFQA